METEKKSILKKLIIVLSIISLFMITCYKCIRNDYDVVSYKDDSNKSMPVIFSKNNFEVEVKYLGTNPYIPHELTIGMDQKFGRNLQTSIKIKNNKRNKKNILIPAKATLLNCNVVLFDNKNNIIPYQSVEVIPYGGLPTGKSSISYTTEKEFVETKPVLNKQPIFLIYYLYNGFLKELATARIDINLTILLDGNIFKIEKSVELKRTRSTATFWGPFI